MLFYKGVSTQKLDPQHVLQFKSFFFFFRKNNSTLKHKVTSEIQSQSPKSKTLLSTLFSLYSSTPRAFMPFKIKEGLINTK